MKTDDNGLAGACVLLVEDDRASAQVARLTLESAKCNVQWAKDAACAALMLLSGLRPTAILLDLALPGASGLDLARFLKAAPETASIPIIAMTASGPGFGRAAARSAGCDGYLSKPIDVATFAKRIASITGGE